MRRRANCSALSATRTNRDAGGSPGHRRWRASAGCDALATTLAVTNFGQVMQTNYALDAWGEILSGSLANNPYVFVGGLGYWYDETPALYYARADGESPAGRDALAVHGDVALVDGLTEAHAADVGIALGEEVVEATAGVVSVDDEDVGRSIGVAHGRILYRRRHRRYRRRRP